MFLLLLNNRKSEALFPKVSNLEAPCTVSGNTYECDIGAFPAGTTVQWFVEATDDLSQVSTSEIEEFTVLALGDLTSMLIVVGVAVVVIIVLVIVMKKRGKE